VDRLLDALDARVRGGAQVVIHCLGGLGRTGVIGGCWLIRRGLGAGEALAMLKQVRNDDRCPETHEQRRFIESYAVRLREGLAGARAPSTAR
jgi:protein-tyrosine phosphatase